MNTNPKVKKDDEVNGDISAQVKIIASEVESINNSIDDNSRKTKEGMNNVITEMNETIGDIEQIYSNLDQAEKEAGDDIDKLILTQAEDLAQED